MQHVMLIGIAPGKHSFHVHCQDEKDNALLRKKFSRTQRIHFLGSCKKATVVMESSGGAHFMARRIADSGHETKMISPQFVRLYCQEQQKRFCRC